MLTISSYEGMLDYKEPALPNLFPNRANEPRPFAFSSLKKVIIITSRVHPGETAGSFVLNGFLKFLLSEDPRAIELLSHFVFKIVPSLNPDGVFRGHYRTDTNGQNLNRLYVNPSIHDYPTIYAIKELFLSIH